MEVRELVIAPGRSEGNYWRDLWQYRELFYFLAWRDLLVRYRQTVFGIAWAVIRPLTTVLVFTLVFGNLAKLPSQGVPYPVLVLVATLPWQFFANALTESSNSVVNNAGMISKVYFPRLVVPASAVMVCFVDLLVSAGLLAVLMLWFRVIPDWRICTLPFWVLVAFAASLGAGLWFAALNVRYRDFRILVPFIVQFGIYVSPVGFSSAIVPERWKLLYSLNPMVGVIDGFRWAILGNEVAIYWPGFVLSLALVVVLLSSGIWYFRRTETTFADTI